MYFGGLFLLFDQFPVYINWFSYTSFLRYSWCALMINQFDHDEFKRIKIFDGKDILGFYSMNDGIESDLWLSVGILAVMLLIFSALGVVALKAINHAVR